MQEEILIKSEKSPDLFAKFKKKMLIWGLLSIPYALFPFLLSLILGFGVDSDIISNTLPIFVTLALFWIGIVLIIYITSKIAFENTDWIVTKTGITQLSKKSGAKTFIPTDHISSVTLVKNVVQIITIDIRRPQGLGFLSNASEMVDTINNLIYSTEKNKNVTITSSDNADEIFKYKTLLDQGVITQEEFEAKKKQLLGL